MTQKLFTLTLLILFAACQQTDDEPQEADEYYTMLSDTIQATSMVHPEDNLPFIDSLEKNNRIPEAVADFFRANTYYALNKKRVVEFYNKKALEQGRLYIVWPKAYYISSRNLANNLRWKGDHENALRYATLAYQHAIDDPSANARLNAPGLLMFIALCQRDLGYEDESRRNLEQSYQQSLELALEDSSFNVCYHLAMNTLTTIMNMDPDTPTEQAELWIDRASKAIAMLTPQSELDQGLKQTCNAMMKIAMAKVEIQHGRADEAEKCYNEFMESAYAKTGNGIVSQYRYMQSAGRWKEAAALIPAVDSVRQSEDKLLTLESLKNMNEEYQIFVHAGMTKQAQQRVERMLNSIDTVVLNQQMSAANEMSSIFETQQRERMIAEQKTTLIRQRLLACCGLMVLIVIFAIIFTYYLRRETKKTEREHKKLQSAYMRLAKAIKKAEVSSRMKTEFIRQVSHEIRTPLNVLSGYAQIIISDNYEMDEHTREKANKEIEANTKRITEMVNKMLELSNLSASTSTDPATNIAVSTIVDKAIEDSQVDRDTVVSFKADLSALPSGLSIHTQERFAIRALSFILANARKFTKEGYVHLTVSSTDEGFIKFIVEDTGTGIPSSEAEHIFEEFVQLDKFAEGTGIGLTLARSFARRLGGDVTLDTSYTIGARFIMTISTDTNHINTQCTDTNHINTQ